MRPRFHPPFERYRVLSAVLRGTVYCPPSWEVPCTVRGLERYRVLSAVLRGTVYCPRSWEVSCTVRGLGMNTVHNCLNCVHTQTADSTRYPSRPRTVHDTSQTEVETYGTFTLNCIKATRMYPDYSPWRWLSRVETYRRLLRIKVIYILVHQLVFVISFV
jgi:hypothetical protein